MAGGDIWGWSSGAGGRPGRPLRAHLVQVGQGAKYEAALRVLAPPAAAHLAKPENAFDPSKRMLHPGAVVGPDPVGVPGGRTGPHPAGAVLGCAVSRGGPPPVDKGIPHNSPVK